MFYKALCTNFGNYWMENIEKVSDHLWGLYLPIIITIVQTYHWQRVAEVCT